MELLEPRITTHKMKNVLDKLESRLDTAQRKQARLNKETIQIEAESF